MNDKIAAPSATPPSPEVEQRAEGADSCTAAPSATPAPGWRRGTLGGSDVAGILGISPWSTPWSVWAETVGLVESEEDNERFDAGHDAEPFLALQFARHEPGLTVDLRQVELFGEADHPWAAGHADGLVMVLHTPDQPIAGWEGKTDRNWKPWEEVPPHYQAQCQWYMWLSGLPRWYVTVGFSGWRTKTYVIERDDTDIALIVERAEKFWNDHILTGIPPEADGHHATSDAIRDAYPTSDPDSELQADEHLAAIVAELDGVKRHLRADTQRKAALENELKAALGERSELVDGGKPIASWRTQTETRVDAKAVRAAHGDTFDCTATKRVLRTHLPD